MALRRVQEIVDGKRLSVAARQRNNPDFSRRDKVGG